MALRKRRMRLFHAVTGIQKSKRRPNAVKWSTTFLGLSLFILLSGCGLTPKTIDTTAGRLPLDSDVALVTRNDAHLKRITRVLDGVVVYDVKAESFPSSMYLTIRVAPGLYRLNAESCYYRHRLVGCATIWDAFELEAGHVYRVGGLSTTTGWVNKETTTAIWFEDVTTEEVILWRDVHFDK